MTPLLTHGNATLTQHVGDVMKLPVTLCLLLFVLLPRICTATGALFVRPLASQQTFTTMSIRTYDAVVDIDDQIAVTHVDQRFFNESDARVEATYIFPLTEGAVITELIYYFNGKKYVANLREKKEAQQDYNEKVRRLIDPALLQYLGDNVFKLNIAPIDARSEVRFEITYAELLPYDFGSVDYRFLLKTTGLSPKPLDRLTLRINAHTATSFKSFSTPSHEPSTANRITQLSPDRYTIDFGDERYVADRDYTVRFQTRRDSVGMNVLTYSPTPSDSFGLDHFYAMWITPPDSVAPDRLEPRDIVVTADVSSSMEGERIEQLREALNAFLDALVETDRFNLVAFGTNVVLFRPDLVPATPNNVAAARQFVSGLSAIGLTNIDEALNASLRMSFGTTTTNLLVFLTDGYPTWGETEVRPILDSAAARNNGRVRIFPFGIGEELSRTLLESLGRDNGGYSTYIASDDSIAIVVRNYFRRVSQPVLQDLAVDIGTLSAYDRYPMDLSDLFWGTQLLQFGRYRNPGEHAITLNGSFLRAPMSMTRSITFSDTGGNRAVARLWAKYKIDFLLGEIARLGERKELVDAIIDLSIHFGILSPYTALYSDPTKDPGASAAPEDVMVPLRVTIIASYPNPFVDFTRIEVALPANAASNKLSVTIHDASGRLIRTLATGNMRPGKHELLWDGLDDAGSTVAAGTYFCRVTCGTETATHALVKTR